MVRLSPSPMDSSTLLKNFSLIGDPESVEVVGDTLESLAQVEFSAVFLRLNMLFALLLNELRLVVTDVRLPGRKLGKILPKPTANSPARYMLTASLPKPKKMKAAMPAPSAIHRSRSGVLSPGEKTVSLLTVELWNSDQLNG